MDLIWAPNFHSIHLHSPEWRKNVLLTNQFKSKLNGTITYTHTREIIEFWDAFKSASDRIYSSYSCALIAHRSCSQIIAWCSYHIETDEENAMVAKFIRWLVTRFPLDRKFNWIFPKLILEFTKLVARRCFESISYLSKCGHCWGIQKIGVKIKSIRRQIARGEYETRRRKTPFTITSEVIWILHEQ